MAKLCPKCGSTKAESEFYVRPNGNIHSWCIACMKQLRVDRNPEIAAYQRRRRKNRSGAEREIEKDYQLQYKFGITLDKYNEILEVQGYCCAVCGKEDDTDLHNESKTKQLGVDHCHKTGLNRGLLCNDCNRGIGQLKEDSGLIRKAAEYLEEWEKRHKGLFPSMNKTAEELFDELANLK